jgi:hypothetical protein
MFELIPEGVSTSLEHAREMLKAHQLLADEHAKSESESTEASVAVEVKSDVMTNANNAVDTSKSFTGKRRGRPLSRLNMGMQPVAVSDAEENYDSIRSEVPAHGKVRMYLFVCACVSVCAVCNY